MQKRFESARRDFLRGSAALAIAQFGAHRSKAAPSDQVNVGLIGVGMRGTHFVNGYSAMPDVNVVAVVDLYDGRLLAAKERTDGKIETGKEYRKLLNRKDIDAVVIATPDHWHKRMVIDAIQAGKDVYCEKPLTWAPEEGQEIRKVMRHSDRILQVGSQIKSSLVTAKAKEIVKSGVLGKITMIRRSRSGNSQIGPWRYPIPPDASPRTVDWAKFLGSARKIPWNPEHFFQWRCWWEYSGGLATDLFVHELTTLHEILDAALPQSVISEGGIYYWNDGRTVPDQLISLFEYPQGFSFLLYANQANSHGEGASGLKVMGSDATLVIGGPDGALAIYPETTSRLGGAKHAIASWPKKMREEYYKSLGFSPEGDTLTPRPTKNIEIIDIPRDNGFGRHIRAFIESVKRRTPSVENVEEGDNAALAAHAANKAYREHRMIDLTENFSG